jgi:hypothetical protein
MSAPHKPDCPAYTEQAPIYTCGALLRFILACSNGGGGHAPALAQRRAALAVTGSAEKRGVQAQRARR